MLTHTENAEELEVFLQLISLKNCNEQTVDGHETIQTGSNWECESVFAWLRERVELNCAFQPSTSRFHSVFASFDEHTALVKSGNVAKKRVWRAVSGTCRWRNLDTVTC